VGPAIVSAIEQAKAKLAPARIGYGTAKIDLNVNRDLFNSELEWRQQPDPNGPSDKTLAVVEFVGADEPTHRRLHELCHAPGQLLHDGSHQRRFPWRGRTLRRRAIRQQTRGRF